MRHYQLSNITIYAADEDLYISVQDDDLVKFSGPEKKIIELIIESFKTTSDKEEVFKLLKKELLGDKSYLDLLIDYLLENKILVSKEAPKKIKKKILIIGTFTYKETMADRIKNVLNKPNLLIEYEIIDVLQLSNKIDYQPYTNADIIVLFSPFMQETDSLKITNDFSIANKIPVFHIGLNDNSYTLGPIFDSKLNSPTLNCYLRRKISSFTKPDQYIVISKIKNKKVLTAIHLDENRYLDIVLGLLGIELHKYFIFAKYYLVGREVEFDGISFSTSITKILKVNTSKNHYSPFNI